MKSPSDISLQPVQLVVIDRNVPDATSILQGLPASAEVLWLESNQDGITQISNALAGYSQVSSLHIISHGDNASLSLGNSSLNADTLTNRYESQLQQWSTTLTEDADILLYGCNIAEDQHGQAFVNRLAELTGADIASSDDLTGGPSTTGDQQLEYTTGQIEIPPLSFANYNYLLTEGHIISGDGSSGGGGSDLLAASGGSGGSGGGDSDTLTGTAGNDLIFGDGHGGGAGGGANTSKGGYAGSGGGGNDQLNGGSGDDILFGDGFNGSYQNGGTGGLGGFINGLGGGAGGNRSDGSNPPTSGMAGYNAVSGGAGGQAGAGTGGTSGENGITAQIDETDTGGTHWTAVKSVIDNNLDSLLLAGTGSGDDILDGGAGNDHLFGMRGNDTYVFDINDAGASDTDVIYGRDRGTNTIALKNNGVALGVHQVIQVMATQADDGGDRILTFSDSSKQVTICLNGEAGTTLTGTDFGLSPPAIADLSGDTLSYTEGDSATLLDQGTALSLTDSDSSNFDGGNLTVTVDSGADHLAGLDTSGSVALAATTASANVSVDGTVIGTLASDLGAGNGLTVNFNGSANATNVTTLLQALTYTNTNTTEPAASTSVSITVNDGDEGTSTAATVNVNITGVNDAPTITATGDSGNAAGAGSAVSVFSAATISAVETENIASVSFTVSGLVDTGHEKLNIDGSVIDLLTDTAGVYTNTTTSSLASYAVAVSGTTATVTFKGVGEADASNTEFQTALNGMTYENTLGAATHGGRVFTLTNVTDVGLDSGDNSNSWTAADINSTITVVDGDTPTATSASKAGTEDTPFTMTTSEIVVAQELNATDALEYITISSISGGTLALTGSPTAGTATDTSTLATAGPLTTGSKVNVSDLTLIEFTPTANATSDGSVVYTVTDAGGDTSAAATLTITLAAVADAPTLTGVTSPITAQEDTATNLITGSPVFADVDTTGDVEATLTASDGNATLTSSDAGGVVVTGSGSNAITLTGTATEINTFLATPSNITYTGASNSSNPDTVTVSVDDKEGGTAASAAAINISITAINDEPVVSATGTGGNATNGAATGLFSSTSINVDTADSGDRITGLTFTVSGIQDNTGELLNFDGSVIPLIHTSSGTTTSNGMAYSVSISAGTATITLTNITGIAEAAIETALNAMTYENQNAGFTEGARVISLTEVTDNGGTSNGGDDTWSGTDVKATVTVVDGTKPLSTSYTRASNEDQVINLSASNPALCRNSNRSGWCTTR
ncbi:MAG: DUF4347 domain-containing protein [Marinobacterium sp.]|nr:DUF4347 domain-containing protein [Marinobacterium sp.]